MRQCQELQQAMLSFSRVILFHSGQWRAKNGWMDGMGWDWMVILGHRSRKSTFGSSNQKRKSLLRYYSSRLRRKVLLKVNIKSNMSKKSQGKTQLFWDADVEYEIYFNNYLMFHMFQ